MKSKVKSIERRHQKFVKMFGAQPDWKAQVSVSDVDLLFKTIEQLKIRVKQAENKKS